MKRMYAQVPRNGDTKYPMFSNGLGLGYDDISPNSSHSPRISEGFVASFSFLIILLTVVVICLSFIKKSVSYFTGKKKVKRTVHCTRISVISDSASIQLDTDMARFLPINEFREHYKKLVSDSYYNLSLEFDSLKIRGDELKPCSEGDRGINRPKNRFVNVLPFDHTRVILTPVNGVDGSDYVNANYVSGFYSRDLKKENREYIATQGPLQNTVNDFWRMVWESGSKCIVMLTRFVDKGLTDSDIYDKYNMNLNLKPRIPSAADREKCYRYWPNCSLPVAYGDVEVEIISERLEGYRSTGCTHKWIITEFKLRHKGQERNLRHYQFKTWPDFESIDPPEALVHFVREVRKCAPYPTLGKKMVPIVIHCSAGVGRTGTFIGVDIVMNQIKNKKAVNIPAIVSHMRTERVWMVQTEQQYICIYKCAIAILDEAEHGDSPPNSNLSLAAFPQKNEAARVESDCSNDSN